jgi:hypothetical protein
VVVCGRLLVILLYLKMAGKRGGASQPMQEPDWALVRGSLRERLEYARDQHALAGGYVGPQLPPTGYKTAAEYASSHRACANWYSEMLDQLDAEPIDEERLARAIHEWGGAPCPSSEPHGWRVNRHMADAVGIAAAYRDAK